MNIKNITEINSIDKILFKINNNSKVTILSSGNVGIFNESPDNPLDVNGDVNISLGSSFKIDGIPIATTDTTYSSGNGISINGTTINSTITQYTDSEVTSLLNSGITGGLKVISGNVGIGTTTPGSYKLYVTGGTTYCDLLYGANIKNTNGIIGNTLTFNRNQVDITVGNVGYLHSMENNPTNGFGFTDNHKRSTNTYGRYIRFWIKGASNGSTVYLQGFSNHYYNSANQLKFIDGTTLTDSTSHCINNTYVEGNKGQRWMVTPWYDTNSVGGDGFRLGVKNIQGSTFYMTQVVLEFTHNSTGLS